MAIHDKTTTSKWTYERSHKSLNSYSLVEYNKIYPNTKSWKTLQEESSWRVNFDNLYFWNILNKTHHGILVWQLRSGLLSVMLGCFCTLVLWPFDIHCTYIYFDVSYFTYLSMCCFFLSLYTCFLFIVCNLLFLLHTKMLW